MQKLTMLLLALCWLTAQHIQAQATTLSETEKAALFYLAEEEKLSHDLYLAFEEKYGEKPFGNILEAEKRHLNHLLAAGESFGVDIPVTIEARKAGKFENRAFQKTYNNFLAMGSPSLEAALRTGALIEETDIRDLRQMSSATDKEALRAIYNRLIDASGNHLRAFNRNLSGLGVTYVPMELSAEDFQAIINDTGGQKGNCPKPCCKNKRPGKCCDKQGT